MALERWIRNTAVRVAFLTDSRFDVDNLAAKGALKKRALRVIERKLRHAVVEDSYRPDVVFYIIKDQGSWVLRRQKDGHRRAREAAAGGARA